MFMLMPWPKIENKISTNINIAAIIPKMDSALGMSLVKYKV